jgi:hypothetical protein
MKEPPELQSNRHWRVAVWSLRAGYLSLAVIITGLIVMKSGSTPWVLAVGVFFWLAFAAVTLTAAIWARSQLPEPRTGWWPLRWMLLYDTVHARPSVQPT